MTTTTDAPATPPPPPEKRKGGAWRIAKFVILAVVLILVMGLVVLYLNLNRIVRSTVEKQSTASLNLKTELESANVSLFGGQVGLRNFKLDSPAGFKAPNMMSLGGIDVGVKLSELRDDPLRVNQITITDPKMVIEMSGTKFNIKQFIDTLPPSEGETMKLIINNLKVEGAQVVFRPDVAALSSLPGVGKNLEGLKEEYVLSIPTLEMQNIGTGEGNENGAEIKEIVTLLVTQLSAKAAESEQLPPELRNVLNLNVSELTKMAKAKLGEELNKQLGKINEDLSKKLPPEAAGALKGVLDKPEELKKDPGKAIQQGLGGLLKKPAEKTAPPATQPK
jgi:uncharacterized protein involved in outer membrane biogenesis